MGRTQRRTSLRGVLAFVTLYPAAASAINAEEARHFAAQEIQSVTVELVKLSEPIDQRHRQPLSAEKRIAAGELSLRTRDYPRAIDIFNQVLELHTQGAGGAEVHADALYLLGEAYFEAGQLLAARRHYLTLLEKATEAPYDSYAGSALSRLVDVAVHTGRLDTLEELQQKALRLEPTAEAAALLYGRGKLHLVRGEFERSSRFLSAIAADSPYYHQAQYMLGVLLTESAVLSDGAEDEVKFDEARLQAALEQFQRVTSLPRDTEEQVKVVDLAWMALGRVLYESGSYTAAAEAYGHLEPGSELYSTMLLEVAWVYVRLGDFQRAQRSLEFLSIAAPETLHVADSALLRADLLLRSGQLVEAEKAYREIRDRFSPEQIQVDQFLSATTDPSVYYDRLVDDAEVQVQGGLPDLVMSWVRDEARSERVFSLIEDVRHAKDLLRRQSRLVARMRALLSAPSRANAFPVLRQRMEAVMGSLHRLNHVRYTLALGLESEDDETHTGALAEARKVRRALMSQVSDLPVTPADFAGQADADKRKWSEVSQALQRQIIEVDRLQAMVNGLERVLAAPGEHGIRVTDKLAVEYKQEVTEHQRAIAEYRRQIDRYREQVEEGRVQVGFGPLQFAGAKSARDRFATALEREVALFVDTPKAEGSEFSRGVLPWLEQMRQQDQALTKLWSDLEAQLEQSARAMGQSVEQEAAFTGYFEQAWHLLDEEARERVGEVARRSFVKARDRLKGIVLRADVGIVQQAWEAREAGQSRLLNLQRERALEQQAIDAEEREVMDVGARR